MEVDVNELILYAAMLKMADQHHTHESFYMWRAFNTMYPEVDILERIRKQVKEYKKLQED